MTNKCAVSLLPTKLIQFWQRDRLIRFDKNVVEVQFAQLVVFTLTGGISFKFKLRYVCYGQAEISTSINIKITKFLFNQIICNKLIVNWTALYI